MLIEKLFPSGMIEISDIIDNHLFRRRYMGYTMKEAKANFKRDLRESQKGGK